MPKLENFATHIKVNGNPFAKNAVNYQVQSADTVGLYYTNERDQRILKGTLARFDDWTDLNDVAYTSFTALIADLDLFLFTNPTDHNEIALGNVPGKGAVNKYGRSTNVDNGIATDIWDKAIAGGSNQPIWLAPTAARIHTIASTSAQDDTGGTGVDTVEVFYLLDWDTKEKSEVITGDISAGIAMGEAAVIIHRIKSTPQATTLNNNVGTITATAASDGTVTAQINPNEGQTQMAIYGIPSIQKAEMNLFYGSVLRANLATNEQHADFILFFNPNPEVQTVSFLVKHTIGCGTRAGSPFQHEYDPPNVFSGPGIFKMQSVGSANNLDISSGFDLILVDN